MFSPVRSLIWSLLKNFFFGVYININHFYITSERARMEIKRNVGHTILNEFKVRIEGSIWVPVCKILSPRICHEYHFSSFYCHYIICSSRRSLGLYRHGMRDVSRVSWKYDLSLDMLRIASRRRKGNRDYRGELSHELTPLLFIFVNKYLKII